VSTVLVCEPQCIGFEHAEFNAALLRTAELAFPASRILFAGESDHVSRVRSRLEEAGTARMEWVEIDVPRRYRSPWKRYGRPRLTEEGLWCAQVRGLAQSRAAGLVMLASVGPAGLLSWKSSASSSDPRTLAFLHGVVASAYCEQGLRRVKASALRAIFRFRAPEGFRYVALGESILAALRALDPRLAERFTAIEIPSLWAAEPLSTPAEGEPALRFGYFGVSEKGFDTFAHVAARVRARHENARFSLVGFLNDRQPVGRWSDVVDGLAEAPLTTGEYARRARNVTYALWTARPRQYRLTASASFVDAIAFGKPSIVLRNPFVEHYFDRLGDIGYLCDSVEEMVEIVESILRAFPEDRYRRQCRNLELGRRRFAPAAVAGRLAEIGSFSPS
jgi:glycosyltransferase involved in cell wall biosynthesis